MAGMKYSVVVPVYRNEASIPRLLQVLANINDRLDGTLETVFVVDGSPDQSYAILHAALADLTFPAQVLAHSRNFGSFPAIRTGLRAARGNYYAVMAADLQEPPELLVTFFEMLGNDECDVVVGTRTGRRNDPWSSRFASTIFWALYRRLVVPDMPAGGVDIFGCNREFRDHLLQLEESRSSLIALIFWLGFRRKLIRYERQPRHEGKSAWTLGKKIDYMMDNIFAFTDYPIRLLIRVGAGGALISGLAGLIVLVARITGSIKVPGYAPTMLAVLFLGAINLFGLGLVGTYAWRAYENSKRRPLAVVAKRHKNDQDN
jgi:glycosyltransferase involved in cell wall biosynthesis